MAWCHSWARFPLKWNHLGKVLSDVQQEQKAVHIASCIGDIVVFCEEREIYDQPMSHISIIHIDVQISKVNLLKEQERNTTITIVEVIIGRDNQSKDHSNVH